MDLITKNSLEGYKSINEGTSESDIASFENIINRLTEDKYKNSLAYQICEVQPLNGPSGAIFVAKKDTNNNIEIIKILAELLKDTGDTGITAEAFEDINRMFKGKRAETLMKNILKGNSDKLENNALLNKIDTVAESVPGFAYSSNTNAETIMFETQTKVAELVIKANENDTVTSLNGFAILPHKVAAAFLGFGIPVNGNDGLFIGQRGKIKYYINPDKTATDMYVGVIEKNAIGKSSLTFSPYQYILSKVTKYDSGETNIFAINRYAITENPLSVNGNKMLFKTTPTFA